MSLLLYSKIPGTQVKRDANLSNATVQCDPTLLFPQGATQGGVPLNKENLAGKIAVEHDICNLDVNNLTVNGTLKVKGPAEVCDIVCPDTFSVVAVNQITMQALGNPTGDRGNIALIAGDDATIDQAPGTADECIMLSAASAGTQTQSADSHIMITAGEGDTTQQGDNSILISAAGAATQTQNADNAILLTTSDLASIQSTAGEIGILAKSRNLVRVDEGSMDVDTSKDGDNGFKLVLGTKFMSTRDAASGGPASPGLVFTGGTFGGTINTLATDVAGSIRIGGAGVAGNTVALTFANGYNAGREPIVIAALEDPAGGGNNIQVSAITNTGFTIICTGAVAVGTTILYHVIVN